MFRTLRSTPVRTTAPRTVSILLLAMGCLWAMPRVAVASTPTTTTLAIAAGTQEVFTVAPRTVVTLTAAVKADGSPVNPGQVTFCDAAAPVCTDIHVLGTSQLTLNGTATLRLVAGPGNHKYAAIFLGTQVFSSSHSAVQTLSVNSPTANDLEHTGSTPLMESNSAANILAAPTPNLAASNLSLIQGATYPTGQLPSATVTADFNGDGILDLAVTVFDSLGTYVPGSLIILLGKGDGTFTAAPTLVTDIFPSALVTADFNGDGKIDLAFADGTDGSISILLGNGDGTFTPAATIFGSFANNGALAVGDFNADGIEDLAVSQTMANTVRILLGNGNGTFTQGSQTPVTGDNPLGMAVGDFNLDGHLDLAVTNVFPQPGSDTPSSVTILLGTGEGTFTAAPAIPVGVAPEQVLTADFNGDGKLDLAVLNIGLPTTISMLFGNGDGTFNSTSPQIPLPYLTWFALGDFNGDHKPDIGGFLEVYQPTNVNQNVYAFLNNGDGTFAPITASDSGIPQDGIAGDFNGDGLTDLAVAGEYGGVTIYLTTVNSLTAATTMKLTSSLNPSTYGQSVTFTATVTSTGGTPTGSVTFADSGAQLATVPLNSSGVAQFTTSSLTANDPDTTPGHDIGATYIPSGSFSGSYASLIQIVNGLPTITTVAVTPNPSTYAQPVIFSAHVAPVTPNTCVPSGTVLLTFCRGAQISLALDASGNASVIQPTGNEISEPVSSCTFTGTYTGDTVFASSTSAPNAYVVTPAPSTTTIVSASPNPSPFSLPVTFTVQVAGSPSPTANPVTGNPVPPGTLQATGTVSLYDGPTLISTATLTAAAAGYQAVFTTSTLALGTHTITASYSGDANLGGSLSPPVYEVITAAPPPDFSIQGTNLSFPVLQSGSGQLELASINNFSGSVALTCDPPIPANYTCTLQSPTTTLAAGSRSVVGFSLKYAVTASLRTESTTILAALFPITLVSLLGLARKRRSALRAILFLTLLAIVATALTACGPDHFIPITTGTFPITFTATGTSQGDPTPITHTVTIQATITP
jgi:hypothetical protein